LGLNVAGNWYSITLVSLINNGYVPSDRGNSWSLK
jgi:hypothetical protein